MYFNGLDTTCQAHNLKVIGSNPIPATNFSNMIDKKVRRIGGLFHLLVNSGSSIANLDAKQRNLAMIDVIYTAKEMDFLVEAAEHFRENAHLYFGSYFEVIDRAAIVPACVRFLESYHRISDTDPPERPTQEPCWVRIRRVGDDFHVQADDAVSNLTCIAVMELRHQAEDQKRKDMITAIIAKSWPHRPEPDDPLLGSLEWHLQ
jgi:hypothetical protein